jgi:glycosyltransferase involved in cell wall biosynthesis
MKTTIYYLTRSYAPYQKGGGSLMRVGAVQYLRELDWKVIVVMPNYSSKELIVKDSIIQIPLYYNIRLASYLERLGFYEDYFDKWIVKTFQYLKNKIKKEDIIFATSGGELGMIKLGSLLKTKINCKFIVNFRDPLDYSLVNGLKLNNKFHISREIQEQKYLQNSDLIITSSKTNQLSLQNKYPNQSTQIVNNYFGYIKQLNLKDFKKISSNTLRIAYVGIMGELQQPEILYKIAKDIDNIKIYFIGDISNNNILQDIKRQKLNNIEFIDLLPHEEFMKFMIENIDIGFVSLTNDYLGACVPSKIYEYINLALPILAALPNGDGQNIINQNNYGISCKYDDINGLTNALKKFKDNNFLNKCQNNILQDRDKWFMKNRIIDVNNWLKVLNK